MTRHLSSPISRPGTPRWEWQQSHFLFPSSKPFVISYQLNQSNLLVLDWLGSHQTECAKTNWDFVSTGAQPHSPEVMTPKTLKTNSHSSTKTIQHRRVSVLFLHFGLFKSISFSWRQGETGSDPPPMVGTKSNFSSDPVWWLPDLDLTKTLQHWTNFVKLDQANQALLRRVLERPSPHLPRLLPRSTEKMILSGNLGNAQKSLICFSWGHP